MTQPDAAAVLETIQAGWSWQMSSMTHKVWLHSLEKWEDTEAAEIAVIELVGKLTRRPNLGEIRQHYEAVARRLEAERKADVARSVLDRVALPAGHLVIPSVPDLAWSPEGARWAVGLAEGRVRAGVLHEGEKLQPTLREEDVIAAEEHAQQAYVAGGATHAERSAAALKALRDLVARKQDEAAALKPTKETIAL